MPFRNALLFWNFRPLNDGIISCTVLPNSYICFYAFQSPFLSIGHTYPVEIPPCYLCISRYDCVRIPVFAVFWDVFFVPVSILSKAYCSVSNIPAKGSWRNSPAVASLLNSGAYVYADAEICHSGDICNLILFTAATVARFCSTSTDFWKYMRTNPMVNSAFKFSNQLKHLCVRTSFYKTV